MDDLEKLKHLRMDDVITWRQHGIDHTDIIQGWVTILVAGAWEPVAATPENHFIPLRYIRERKRVGEPTLNLASRYAARIVEQG